MSGLYIHLQLFWNVKSSSCLTFQYPSMKRVDVGRCKWEIPKLPAWLKRKWIDLRPLHVLARLEHVRKRWVLGVLVSSCYAAYHLWGWGVFLSVNSVNIPWTSLHAWCSAIHRGNTRAQHIMSAVCQGFLILSDHRFQHSGIPCAHVFSMKGIKHTGSYWRCRCRKYSGK